jgi:hypothetical protein
MGLLRLPAAFEAGQMNVLPLSPIVPSAPDATNSDHAVLGGIVLNRKDIPEFDTAWNAALT